MGEGFVKCLGFIAGVSFARLTLSTCSLFFALSCSFVPLACLFGNPVSSARAFCLYSYVIKERLHTCKTNLLASDFFQRRETVFCQIN